MNSLRAIPRRLLPDDCKVLPPDVNGGFGKPRYLKHVRFDGCVSCSDDEHRSDAVTGTLFVDAMNTVGAYQVQVGSRIILRGVSMVVASVKRLEGPNGRVHHWELGVR